MNQKHNAERRRAASLRYSFFRTVEDVVGAIPSPESRYLDMLNVQETGMYR